MKYYFLLHNSENSRGENAIMIRVSAKRKSKYFALGISTKDKHWNKEKNRVKKTDLNHSIKNQMIDAYDQKAQKIILSHVVNNQPLTLIKFIEELSSKNNGSYTSFFDYAESVADKKKSEINTTTHNNYQFQYNKLKEFKKDFTLLDVDRTFLYNYSSWLKEEKKNQDSTISKSLTYLRMILNEALSDKLINESPFKDFKIKEIKSKDEFLTIEELKKLEELHQKPENLTPKQAYTLKYFLFSCYTGISFGDLERLRFEDIKTINIEGNDYKLISNERLKTGIKYRAPLTKKAILLLDKQFSKKQKLFNVSVNQVTNRHLKKIKKIKKIEKHITFHIARHTYATHQINTGIGQKTLMEAMGHKTRKVNDMYSKVQDETIIKEILLK
jgi:integrase